MEFKDFLYDTPRFGPEPVRYEIARYFPETMDADIPEDGHWIMITYPPHTTCKVKKFSIFYAMNDFGEPHYKYNFFFMRYAKIRTKDGDLRLWPWEYRKIDISKYLEIIDGEHLTMKFLAKNPVMEKEVVERVFYLQTRGIPKKDCYALVLPELKDPSFCYFEFHEEYINYFTR